MEKILRTIESVTPRPVYEFFRPAYHLSLAFCAALFYGFPSRKIKVIAVTGTKGKSSTTEIINAILEEAGYKTALSNTIRFKIGNESRDNLYKMSMPGRFFIQRLLREAVTAHCEYMIMEVTSQGALLSRHRFINMDELVFTNLSPEHIEAHGSYEKYRDSKLSIARALSHSSKKNTVIIANADDKESALFLAHNVTRKITFSTRDAEPFEIKNEGISFTYKGIAAASPLSGLFNLSNILAAAATAESQGVRTETIIQAIGSFSGIPGRVQKIYADKHEGARTQDFSVVVDYAHTADSLEKFYKVFPSSRNICILGGTGGGRDTWKRSEMGRIAEQYCNEVILTDEDPYDEDPNKIVADIAAGMKTKKPTVIMDRREAIREALKRAQAGDAVLITGKGTDPYIMGPRGTKTPWSDAKIAKEELENVLKATR